MRKNFRVFLLILAEVCAGIMFCLVSLRAFYELAERILRRDVVYLDEIISWFVYSFRNPVLTEIMKFITFLGSGYWLSTITVLTIGYLIIRKHKRPALLFGLSLIACAGLNLALKHFVDRPRPYMSPLVIENTTSFPSGHAMNSFVFYFTLVYFIYHYARNQYVLSKYLAIAISVVSLVGLSRVYLGVHYPSDVAAGYLAGFTWLLATMVIEKTLYVYRVFRVMRK